jgi:hypothetical protein
MKMPCSLLHSALPARKVGGLVKISGSILKKAHRRVVHGAS